jgi:hypothetical protein
MYGLVSVSCFLRKEQSSLTNITTLIMPLSNESTEPKLDEFDYGDIVLLKTTITIENLIELISSLPQGPGSFKIGNRSINIDATLEQCYDYLPFDNARSDNNFVDIPWKFTKCEYAKRTNVIHYHSSLTAAKLPFFPDRRSVLRDFIGINTDDCTRTFGVFFILPDYSSRIKEVIIGSTTLKVNIETRYKKNTDVIGKLYCSNGTMVMQDDIVFDCKEANGDFSGTINIEQNTNHFQIVLLSKIDNSILDKREINFGWTLPEGVFIDIPDYNLEVLIKNGENQTTEFKKTIGDGHEFAETVVAFANSQGGIIIIGVDNKTNIVGLDNRDHINTITNIISSLCEPTIEYYPEERSLQQKELVLVKVMEGRNKPYSLRDRGVYIRAHATDRIATRFELDEIYSQKYNQKNVHENNY